MKISKEGAKIILTWKKDEKDIKKAKEIFKKLTSQGWIAAKYNGKLQRVLEFKPEYEKLLFIPLSFGG